MDPTTTIAEACSRLAANQPEGAADVLRRQYPFVPIQSVERQYGEIEATRVFVRDGFVDRYSGKRLVFPGALRVLALSLPDEFPFQSNWRMSETHIAFWELSSTVDHVVPVARGGIDTPDNWVTTSMLRNSAKANWKLEELGWQLHPAGSMAEWDGMLGWFKEYLASHLELGVQPTVRRWLRAAVAV